MIWLVWTLLIGETLGALVFYAFVISSWLIAGTGGRDFFRNVYHECKPFYWPAVIVMIAGDVYPHSFITYVLNWVHWLNLVTFWIAWIACKDVDDDDRWKRRRRKLAEAVKSIGSKLVVVPAPAGA